METISSFDSTLFWIILITSIVLGYYILFVIIRYATRTDDINDKLSNIDHKLGMLLFEYKKNHEVAEPDMEKTFGGKSLSEFYNEAMKKSEQEEKIKHDSGLK
jgi:hypothetical protein